jgi:hypothetical protein
MREELDETFRIARRVEERTEELDNPRPSFEIQE